MDPASLDRAHAEVRRRLESVREDRWELPTPCEGRSVRDLVEHMAVGATMSRQVLAGEPWARGAVVGEVLSALDLKAEWEWRTAEERAGFAAPGALGRTVAHRVMGDLLCAQFLGMRVGDALLHAWDLARAVRADEELDPELIAEVWARMSPIAGLDRQERLLRLGAERSSRRGRTTSDPAPRLGRASLITPRAAA